MGLFGKLFGGGEPELPALDPASAGAQILENFRPQFEALIKKIDDRYEVVPSEKILYVFLGKPPGMFGIAWFVEGDAEEHNMKKLMSRKGLPQRKIDNIMMRLRTSYTEMQKEPRFGTQVAGKKVVVTPSAAFADQLYTILHVMDE